jgi:hypothetical protein
VATKKLDRYAKRRYNGSMSDAKRKQDDRVYIRIPFSSTEKKRFKAFIFRTSRSRSRGEWVKNVILAAIASEESTSSQVGAA